MDFFNNILVNSQMDIMFVSLGFLICFVFYWEWCGLKFLVIKDGGV